MNIKKLTPTDIQLFEEQVLLFGKVFEMNDFQILSTPHLQGLLQQDNFMAFVALREGRVIGGLTAYVLHQYYAEKPLAYLYDLAVNTEDQGKGIGSELVKALCNYCQKQGFEEVFVQADRDEPQNLDFYRKAQPTGEEDVIHFTYGL